MAGTSHGKAGKAASLHSEAPVNASRERLPLPSECPINEQSRTFTGVIASGRSREENSDPKPSLDAVNDAGRA